MTIGGGRGLAFEDMLWTELITVSYILDYVLMYYKPHITHILFSGKMSKRIGSM
jgi:hypothetical protein